MILSHKDHHRPASALSRCEMAGGPTRSAAVIASVCAISLPILVWPGLPAEAEEPVHQWNAARNFHEEADAPSPPDVVAFIVALNNPKPRYITLNELCLSDFGPLKTDLEGVYAPYDLEGQYTVTDYESEGCDGRAFGNAIYYTIPGPDYVQQSYEFPGQASNDTDGGGYRRMICVAPYGSDFACSLHLTGLAEDADIARRQANEALYIVSSPPGPISRFLGGDFNLQPDDQVMVGYNDNAMYDGDHGYNDDTKDCSYGESPSIKIDYFFGGGLRGNTVFMLPPASVVRLDSSDHCYFDAGFIAVF